jgi:hypothetical protein
MLYAYWDGETIVGEPEEMSEEEAKEYNICSSLNGWELRPVSLKEKYLFDRGLTTYKNTENFKRISAECIRRIRESKLNLTSTAYKYGVSKSYASQIRRGLVRKKDLGLVAVNVEHDYSSKVG